MKINRVDIFGFKSFVNKTSIPFGEGISAIIGPNGCGKSNIVDAIRWVLGEQSPRQLRGGNMQDVIFSGNERRPSLGVAEVTITLTNGNGTAPPPFEHLSEIAVSRRLYRSGESEYLINKKPCRLKDVTYLFMDTGVGTQLYSIIDQGQIAAFIEAKPLDRKPLIHEVAGISKFTFKREEASRKIEQTRQNLFRIDDILGEVKKQMSTLHRQAKKADRYIKLKQRLKVLDLYLSALEFQKWLEILSRKEQAITVSQEEERIITAKISALELDHEKLELESLGLEKNIEQKKAEAYQLGRTLQEKSNRFKSLKERLEDLGRQKAEIAQAIERNERREKDMRNDIAGRRKGKDSYISQMSSRTRWLSQAESEFQESRKSLRLVQDELEDLKMQLVDVLSRESSCRNSINNLERSLSGLSQRKKTNRATYEESLSISRKNTEILASKMARKDKLELEIKELIPVIAELKEREKSLTETKAALDGKLRDLTNLHSQKSAKFDLLKTLHTKMEGIPAASVNLLKNAREGVHGIFAEKLESNPDYTRAVEAALGERLESILVNDLDCALECIKDLKQKKLGKSGFILKEGKPSGRETGSSAHRLLSEISTSEPYNELAGYLLGNVYWARDIEEARDLWLEHRGECTVVTLEGDLIDASGFIRGGSTNGGSATFFSRKEEMRKLQKDLEEVRAKLDGTHQSLETAAKDLGKLQSERQEKEKDFSRKQFDLRLAGQELEQLAKAEEMHKKRLAVLLQENSELDKETAERNQELEGAKTELEELGSSKALLESDIDEKSLELRNLENEMEASRTRLTQAKVEITSFKEKVTALEADINRLEQERARIIGQKDRLREKGEDFLGQERQTQEEMSSLRETLSELEKLQHDAEILLEAESKTYQQKRALTAETFNKLRLLQKDLKEITAGINSLNLTRTEAQLNMDHLQKNIMETYQISLADEFLNFVSGPLAPEQAREEIQTVKEDLSTIGEVNLTAIEEYKTLEERYKFLSAQREDLTSSLEGLEQAIRKINKTSKERIHEAVAAINEKLSLVIPMLFGGGTASLKLTDPEDPLGSGIDLYVQPPGKKLTSLSLLSSGEKTMATLALLFAVYMVKPSPFCLLDEVDAPLDDANAERFNSVLRQISRDAQIIVITHNQKIMEAADILYGVTMEEKGVSKLLSVRLN